MKKFFTLFTLILIVSFAMAQTKSQRLVLVEEFTNASCGPCAAYNPGFNAILQSPGIAEKVVAIKYQTNWPGADPMNAQTQSDVGPRVTYYGVTGVPNAVMDGNKWQNNPASFTAALVTNEDTVSSPYTMSVNHHLSVNYDSIYISVIITATDVVTGNLVLQTAIVEDVIDFASAPGTNGEKEFYNVMRKMLPNYNGTALPGTWTIGDADTITFALKLPAYIYNLDQVSIVAWVQDNTTKNVKQAGFSPANTVGADMGIASVDGLPAMTCTLPVNCLAVIKNSGTVDVTACTVKWQLDNGTIDSLNWTGTLAVGDTFQIANYGMSPSYGNHVFKMWVVSTNGGAVDIHVNNNLKQNSFIVVNQSFPSPVFSGFETSTFPPTNWFIVNPGDDNRKWSRFATAGGFGLSAASTRIQFYFIAAGGIDEFYLPPIDLSTASAAVLTFNVAHGRYSTTLKDRLRVDVSADCGATWTSVYNKIDPSLATTSTIYGSSEYVPTAAQWREEIIDMNVYIGQPQVFVKFVAVSGYGNDLYLDNINLTPAVGINEPVLTETSITVYPNPFSTTASIDISLNKTSTVDVKLVNLIGQTVYTEGLGLLNAGKNTITIDGDNLNPGMYYMHLNVDGRDYTRKVMIAK